MANFSAEYSRTYNSMSGVDIQASFAGVHVSDLQGISFTVTREKGPMYTMGSPNARGFSRGRRLPRNCAQNGETLTGNADGNPVAKLHSGDAVQTHA